jgi:hypothetical protein
MTNVGSSWSKILPDLADSTREMPMISAQRHGDFDDFEATVVVCERAAA